MRLIKIQTKDRCVLVPEDQIHSVLIQKEKEGEGFRIGIWTGNGTPSGGALFRVETLQPSQKQAIDTAAEILGADLVRSEVLFQRREPNGRWI